MTWFPSYEFHQAGIRMDPRQRYKSRAQRCNKRCSTTLYKKRPWRVGGREMFDGYR